ncbi:hypothetical protein [Pararhodobacter aggregans]|uniref:Uncharacterized protein n=1 Tax=Pararhodobacter aggregans TaxID=404875 RepID=A0A2T7UXN4_9RHOB|nr:hypothetical protein [Pararhodobacter aggregans]PTX05142.1 hypothetical protein C8N33_101558 [Pararhodobacter aggregans]PVE49442.1 hypothetical protein DDE23_03340 [Pararhodobacter aggregans]
MTQALTNEEKSKDEFFQALARVAEDMVEKHGKEFASGALILAAQWVAQNRIGKKDDPMH